MDNTPWQPISNDDLQREIDHGVAQMTPEQLNLWNAIQVPPLKWALHPWGDLGGGFWVVAILGQTVVWYNDIEDGFNRSAYSSAGTIDEYWCNQDELQWTIGHVLRELETGSGSGDKLGPPEPIT
jgi:hypothetical protein